MDEEKKIRSATLNVLPPPPIEEFSSERHLTIFEKMCLSRYFEYEVIEAVKNRRTTYPMYMSLGQEVVAATISTELKDFAFFPQHRCHDLYLALGGPPEKLRDELLGLPTGVCGGKGGSNYLQCHENGITMFGHHGLIGENVPLGVGAALATRKPTVCIFGDGAAEEDYVFVALGFAVTHKLPILFICTDNNLSILTEIKTRRSWDIVKVADAIGMPTVDIADDPWTMLYHIQHLVKELPAFINIRVCRELWHVGVYSDGPTEWNRFDLVKQSLIESGYKEEVQKIEAKNKSQMEALWA